MVFALVVGKLSDKFVSPKCCNSHGCHKDVNSFIFNEHI